VTPARHPRHPALTSVIVPVCHRACCQLVDRDENGEVTFAEFVQIADRMETSLEILAAAFRQEMERLAEVKGDYADFSNYADIEMKTVAEIFDLDSDGYVTAFELGKLVRVPFELGEVGARDVFYFTRGQAQLALMMADRDGDGRLSMTEMIPLVEGSYLDDKMTPMETVLSRLELLVSTAPMFPSMC
jgi:Ca2+-binding EF-hand superfamily protein